MLYRFVAIAKRPATRMFFNTGFKPLLGKSNITKSVLLRSSTCQVMQNSPFHSKSINYFASSHDWNSSKPPTHPLIEKIQQHPHIMDQLVDFTNLLQTKGVDVSGKKPSFMQVFFQIHIVEYCHKRGDNNIIFLDNESNERPRD